MGCVFCWEVHAMDRANEFGVRYHHLSFDVLRHLPDDVRRPFIQPDHGSCNTGAFRLDFPGGMVCRIHVEPDACNLHDPHTQNPVRPEPCFGILDAIDFCRHCGADHHPVYFIRAHDRVVGIAAGVFCVARPDDRMLYGIGDSSEKTLCKEIW